MTTTIIDKHVPVSGTGQSLDIRPEAGSSTAKPETELRAAARRRGLTMKELAARMGVTPSYLSQIATGGKPWTQQMREKAASVLGEGSPVRASSTAREAW